MAYRTVLTTPPDGKTHHTFQPKCPAAPSTTGNINNRPNTEGPKAKFSRLTHSTFYRFITGHAFVGEYMERFFPQHTPDQIACQCGAPLQTIEHVIMHCPLFTAARLKHLVVTALQGRGFRFRCFRGSLQRSQGDQLLVYVQALNVDYALSFKGCKGNER